MAGIGFELRKAFGKKTLLSTVSGSLYAAFSTIGPTLVFILLLFGLQYILYLYNVSEFGSLFFVASFTYLFLVAILVATAINTVLSRYIADKVFSGKEDDICASIFGVLSLSSMISGTIIFGLCVMLYIQDGVPLTFLIAYYLLGILATHTYCLMSYISAIKEYKQVTCSFAIGLLLGIPIFFLVKILFKLGIIISIYYALLVGFLVINIFLLFWCIRAFGKPSNKTFEFLSYFKKYFWLFISGCSYILGLYMTNIIYWHLTDMSVKVSIFKIAPNYDMAIFLAMVMNLSAMVIFVVKTETQFYDKYVEYLSALNQGTYRMIERVKDSMIRTMKLQLFFIYDMQLIITILAICILNVVVPYLGINTQILNMCMLLALGIYCCFCMYFTIVFLYYFEDYKSAGITTTIFLVVEIIMALICLNFDSAYYPVALLASSIVGWITGYILLEKRLKNLNSYLLCL